MRVICETINAGMQPLQNLSTRFIHVVILSHLYGFFHWSLSARNQSDPVHTTVTYEFDPQRFHFICPISYSVGQF